MDEVTKVAAGMTDKSNRPRYVAKLTGNGGIQIVTEFVLLTDAMRWLNGVGLEGFGGKADRADVYLAGSLVWTKANPMVAGVEQAELTEAEQLLAKLAADKS